MRRWTVSSLETEDESTERLTSAVLVQLLCVVALDSALDTHAVPLRNTA